MPISRIVLLALLIQIPPPQQPVPAAPASIEGVVVKTATGESLSKVTVTLTETRNPAAIAADLQSIPVSPNSPEYALIAASINPRNISAPVSVTTMSDGRFVFENLKPGTYSLKASLGGYAPVEYGQRGPNGRGMTITLKPGQKMQGISLTMTPGGSITGHVVDANGDPLGRALVQAQKLVYQEQGRSLVTVQAVPTDDKGEFRLFWLPPGQYYISAMPPDDRMASIPVLVSTPGNSNPLLPANVLLGTTRDVLLGVITGVPQGMKVTSRTLPNGDVIEEAAVRVYYPAGVDISTASPIEIRAGGIISGIDITAKTSRVFRIRGMLVSATTGKPVASSQITLMQGNGSTSTQINPLPQQNSAGFEIAGVLPGSYLLLAMGSDGPGVPITAIAPVEVQGNVENVIVTGTTPFAIRGRISTIGAISNSTNTQTYRLRLDPQLPGLPGVITGGVNIQVRPDDFTIPIAIPTDYRVSLTTPPNTYIQSIRYGGQDVLRDGLHIAGPTSEALEIVLNTNAGRLEGDVMAERQKFSNATVVLMPSSSLRQQTNLYQTVQSNAEGHFTFENIPPGTYKVFAWEDVETFAWFDAEFMRNNENRGTEVVIRESAKEKVDLTVIPR